MRNILVPQNFAGIEKSIYLKLVDEIPVESSGKNEASVENEIFANVLTDYIDKESWQEISDTISTGISNLDYHIGGGIFPGEITVIGSRPGIGKTTFALHIACNAVKSRNRVVAFFSLHETVKQMILKTVSMIGGIETIKIKSNMTSENEETRIKEILAELKTTPLCFDDTIALDMDKFNSRCIEISQKFGKIGLIIIDDIQTFAQNCQKSKTKDTVGELRGIARQMQIPILLISQLNPLSNNEYGYGLKSMRDPRNQLDLAHLSDLVLILHTCLFREDSPMIKWDNSSVIIAKQKVGEAGIEVIVLYDKSCGLFANSPCDDFPVVF